MYYVSEKINQKRKIKTKNENHKRKIKTKKWKAIIKNGELKKWKKE